MATTQFLTYLVVMFVLMLGYNLYLSNNRIMCRITRRDKSVRKKWAKPVNGERIEDGSAWYYVRTKCIKSETSFFGLIPVRVLDFSYLSSQPLDPDSGEPVAESPEVRRNLDKREDIEAYNEGGRVAMGKGKIGFMGGGIMPIILVIGVVASVYFIWQLMGKIDMLGQAVNVLQNMMMSK